MIKFHFLEKIFQKLKDNFPTNIFFKKQLIKLTSMLEGVVKRGTGKKFKRFKFRFAGKTGTTNNNTDAWFIGFTSNLVVGVYVGFDDPKSFRKN